MSVVAGRPIALQLTEALMVRSNCKQRGERAALVGPTARAEAGVVGSLASRRRIDMDAAALEPDAHSIISIEEACQGYELREALARKGKALGEKHQLVTNLGGVRAISRACCAATRRAR
eukprot:6537382-Prymnesium_polylepis.1